MYSCPHVYGRSKNKSNDPFLVYFKKLQAARTPLLRQLKPALNQSSYDERWILPSWSPAKRMPLPLQRGINLHGSSNPTPSNAANCSFRCRPPTKGRATYPSRREKALLRCGRRSTPRGTDEEHDSLLVDGPRVLLPKRHWFKCHCLRWTANIEFWWHWALVSEACLQLNPTDSSIPVLIRFNPISLVDSNWDAPTNLQNGQLSFFWLSSEEGCLDAGDVLHESPWRVDSLTTLTIHEAMVGTNRPLCFSKDIQKDFWVNGRWMPICILLDASKSAYQVVKTTANLCDKTVKSEVIQKLESTMWQP